MINNIVCGDCLKIMRDMPSESVDVSFADPPFNLNKKYTKYKDNKISYEYLDWCKEWISEVVRITKPTGSIFIHNIPKWLIYYASYLNELAFFKHWISWDASSGPMGSSLQPSHYGILYYVKNDKVNKFYEIRCPHKRCRKCDFLLKDYGGKKGLIHPFGPLLSDCWSDIHRIRHKKNRDNHPCQLPLSLLDRIILMSTDAGDVVFDPFVGTGTSAVSAKRLNRQYIGIDIDENYINIAKENLDKEIYLSTIADGRAYVGYNLNEVCTIRDVDWEEISCCYIIPPKIEHIDSHRILLKYE